MVSEWGADGAGGCGGTGDDRGDRRTCAGVARIRGGGGEVCGVVARVGGTRTHAENGRGGRRSRSRNAFIGVGGPKANEVLQPNGAYRRRTREPRGEIHQCDLAVGGTHGVGATCIRCRDGGAGSAARQTDQVVFARSD